MKTVTATEASRGFSRLLDGVARGERVTITRAGRPVATVVPPKPAATIGDIIDTVRRVGPIDADFAGEVAADPAHLDMTPPDRWRDA